MTSSHSQLATGVSRQIDTGIANAKYGIVVISRAFIGRPWPDHELRGLVNRDIEEDLKILPIWHGVNKQEVAAFSPSLSDKFAINTQNDDAQEAALKILRTVRLDLYEQSPRAELERMASGEALSELQSAIDNLRKQVSGYQCPMCNAPLSTRTDAPIDGEHKHWDVVETYKCGHQVFAGLTQYPCPEDPRFPTWDDYDVVCERTAEIPSYSWRCDARPKTDMAQKVLVDSGYGKSEEHALQKVKATYLYRAGQISNMEWYRPTDGFYRGGVERGSPREIGQVAKGYSASLKEGYLTSTRRRFSGDLTKWRGLPVESSHRGSSIGT